MSERLSLFEEPFKSVEQTIDRYAPQNARYRIFKSRSRNERFGELPKPGEVYLVTDKAHFIHDPDSSLIVNGLPCRELPINYSVTSRANGTIVTTRVR